MDSFGAVRTLNGEAPLYVGGRGPLQNTPPSSAGTLTTTLLSITTLPPRFVTTATNPFPSTTHAFCQVQSSPSFYLHLRHPPRLHSGLCLLVTTIISCTTFIYTTIIRFKTLRSKSSNVKTTPPAGAYENCQTQSAFVRWWHDEFTRCSHKTEYLLRVS